MNKLMPKHRPKKGRNKKSGFALSVVVITGLIITIATMTLASRSINNLLNSTRQEQKREANKIAENGVTLILKELNDNFSYLLTESCIVENNLTSQQTEEPECAGWKNSDDSEGGVKGTFQKRDEFCPNAKSPSNLIMDKLYTQSPNSKGKYRLISYSFAGDQYQGGWATIKVQGQRLVTQGDKTRIAATAIVQQEVTIAPKYCDLPPFEEKSFGLLAGNVSLNGSSIIDEIEGTEPSQASVNCNNCGSPPDPDLKTKKWKGVQSGNSVIDGERSSNPTPKPTDFAPPQWQWGNKQQWNLTRNSGVLNIGHNTHPKYCHTEAGITPVTHCRMGNIAIAGGKVNVNPGTGEINFYLQGQSVAINTDSFVNTSGKFGQVAFFGQKGGPWGNTPQLFALSGRDKFGPIFLQMPHTNVPLSGDIDIVGAAIVKSWNASGNSDLIIPRDAARVLSNKYEIEFGVREFAAIGINRWNLIQLEK